jgi:hypothetical protein
VPLDALGRTLLILGLVIAGLGGLLLLAGWVPWLGRLPGDLSFERGNVRFYAPLATGLLISVVLTVVLNLLARR